ncbi:histidinol-phosphatase [Geminisphaera colitermitum]|uniref:histidinol-phosphatase n=1 Tax=Geminisphaera colitermitum TaxID=1148786 RepID=UPI000158D12D|nr:histidinol-phosphatase [Geminisphaera colitermitum]
MSATNTTPATPTAAAPTPLLYESHCHTPLCKHAQGEPWEYAATAEARGLRGIIFTCHSPLPDGWSADVRMAPGEFDLYVDTIAQTRERFADRVDVRLGLESDYYPGVEPWLEKLHARVPLHHVLGSVHYQIHDYRRRYFTGDILAYQKLYYEHLAASAETGLFDTLAHPDLVKNESPADWDFEHIRSHIARALDRIAATGVAMELNTSGLQKALPEMNPGPGQLVMMRERGIPVVLGADAHRPERVAAHYADALRLLQTAGYQDVSWFLDRRRQTVPITAALASLPRSARF